MAGRTSAALLAYFIDASGALQVFIGHMGGPFWARKDDGGWSIPKGEYLADEEAPVDVARREFAEEIGTPAPPGDLIDLGVHVQPSRKRIQAYGVSADATLRYIASNEFELEWPAGSGQVSSFPEIDRAQWFPLAEARRKVVSGQVPILDALVDVLRERGALGSGSGTPDPRTPDPRTPNPGTPDPSTPDPIVSALLERHGRTYSAEAGIDLEDATATSLFRLLCLSLLLSARIRPNVAVRAARALAEAGWADPVAMAGSTWEDRCLVLDEAGYARYDERTSRMLASTAERVLAQYHGDLSELRSRARHQPAAELVLLQDFAGIGPLGAAIFAREVQATWPELYPFADDRVVTAARGLGLEADAVKLSCLVSGRSEFTRLVAALVRCSLARDEAGVLDRARELAW